MNDAEPVQVDEPQMNSSMNDAFDLAPKKRAFLWVRGLSFQM